MKKLIVLLFIATIFSCSNNDAVQPHSIAYYKINKNYFTPQKSWNTFLSALSTGNDQSIKIASTDTMHKWTKNWLDQSDYSQMCRNLGDGWSRGDIEMFAINRSLTRGQLNVPFFSLAYFYFGSPILVEFQKNDKIWKVKTVSFPNE